MRFCYAESMTDPSSTPPSRRRRRTPATTRWSCRTASATRANRTACTRSTRTAAGSSSRTSRSSTRSRSSPRWARSPRRLRFVTFVLKLPVRHPVLVAKQATSVAVLTGGRLVLGVGSSPWPEDYAGPRRAVGRTRAADGRGASRSSAAWPRGGYFELPRRRSSTCRRSRSRPVPGPADPDPLGGHGDAGAAPRRPAWATAGCTAAVTPRQLPGLLARLTALRREEGSHGPARSRST